MADVIAEAQALFRESLDCQRLQRQQMVEDITFSDPSNPQQWDEEIKRARENDPGGKRPCLNMDQLGQYVSNIAGQVEKQPPALHAIPEGGGATKEAAEQIDGRFRHIEHASRAQQHYSRAMTNAARLGVGYLTIRPDYVNRALGWQEPRIGSVADSLNAVVDPWSVDTDGADIGFGYILSPLSEKEFNRRWPGKEAKSFGDTEAPRIEMRPSIIVAEQFFKEEKTRNMIVYVGLDGEEAVLSEEDYHAESARLGVQLKYVRNFKEKYQCVKWRNMSGCDVLEESEYPSDHVGIVPVYGYTSFADGRMSYCGVPRRGRAGQQAYNWNVSEMLAYTGTAPRNPWMIPERAIGGNQALFDRMHVDHRAYVPYIDRDDDGPISPPTRVNPSVNLANYEAGAERALRDIQASLGMYEASLGERSNETSGVAIEARKAQGEASTAHFPAHLAASLGQVGRIVMQMDGRLLDRKRTVSTIGFDESAGTVTVDPEQEESHVRGKDGVSINPGRGSYGVRVVIGASYSTQRSQNNAAFTEMMRGNPELATVIAPFWAQTLDINNGEKLAQALATLTPPAVQAIIKPEGEDGSEPDPVASAAQIKQLQDGLQQATAIAQEAEAAEDQAVDALHKMQVQLANKEREADIAAYNAETARLKVTGANDEQIQAIVSELMQSMMARPDPETPVEPLAEPAEPQAWQSQLHMQQASASEPVEPMDEPAPVQEPEPVGEPIPEPEMPTVEDVPPEPVEPAPPSPEVQALIDGQQGLMQAVMALVELSGKSRKKVPVRDKAGNLLHVIESLET